MTRSIENGRRHRLIEWIALAVFLTSLGLAVVAARAIAVGEPDAYHNQHLRLLANSLTLLFLSSGQALLFRERFRAFQKVGWVLWVACFCTLAWSVWLMRA